MEQSAVLENQQRGWKQDKLISQPMFLENNEDILAKSYLC